MPLTSIGPYSTDLFDVRDEMKRKKLKPTAKYYKLKHKYTPTGDLAFKKRVKMGKCRRAQNPVKWLVQCTLNTLKIY
jgi:hypothetical protein